MARYAITYRFREDAGAQARRDSLLREIARCSQVWEEMGDVALVEATETIGELETRLYLESDLNTFKDRLLVIELADAPAAARGMIANRDGLRALLPRVSFA